MFSTYIYFRVLSSEYEYLYSLYMYGDLVEND